MALVNNGTKVSVHSSLIPAGYEKPAYTPFEDQEYSSSEMVLSIAKSGVEDADETTTFADILAALIVLIEAKISADYDTTGMTITIWIDWKAVITNAINGSVLYTNGAVNYECTVIIHIKSA